MLLWTLGHFSGPKLLPHLYQGSHWTSLRTPSLGSCSTSFGLPAIRPLGLIHGTLCFQAWLSWSSESSRAVTEGAQTR